MRLKSPIKNARIKVYNGTSRVPKDILNQLEKLNYGEIGRMHYQMKQKSCKLIVLKDKETVISWATFSRNNEFCIYTKQRYRGKSLAQRLIKYTLYKILLKSKRKNRKLLCYFPLLDIKRKNRKLLCYFPLLDIIRTKFGRKYVGAANFF